MRRHSLYKKKTPKKNNPFITGAWKEDPATALVVYPAYGAGQESKSQ
jgi:hypothetical protein